MIVKQCGVKVERCGVIVEQCGVKVERCRAIVEQGGVKVEWRGVKVEGGGAVVVSADGIVEKIAFSETGVYDKQQLSVISY